MPTAAQPPVQSAGLARIPDAAKYLAISRAMVYRLMDRGDLSYVLIGSQRRVRWSDLRRLAGHNTAASE